MSGGKIRNSLALMPSIENTNSLVQLNFDFTLRKTEAPPEYRMIGQSLSNSRRLNAEDGTAHSTARKLGWLSGQIVPETPQLVTAHGRRVSEILQIPGINPAGSEADGPIWDFIGADCTFLWAAGTSWISALGVHLLACILARGWDGPKATAICLKH